MLVAQSQQANARNFSTQAETLLNEARMNLAEAESTQTSIGELEAKEEAILERVFGGAVIY